MSGKHLIKRHLGIPVSAVRPTSPRDRQRRAIAALKRARRTVKESRVITADRGRTM
jgi:hypothetical protein